MCDKTQIVKNFKNLNCDKTQKSNCDKRINKKIKCDKTQIFKL